MACNRCNRGKCRCKKVTIFDDRPEVIKVNTIPVPGEDGENGLTPYVGENGNWWIGGSDTGIPATGPEGESIEPVTSDDITF